MLLSLYSVIWFAVAVLADGITFTNPVYTQGHTTAQNTIYQKGSVVDITWTQGDDPNSISLVLFQINATSGDLLYPFEYLAQNVLNVTSLAWNVFTSKDLTISPLFVFNIFYTGATSPTAVSSQFNISSPATGKTSSTSSSSTSSSSTSTSSQTTLSTSTTAAVTTPAAATNSGSAQPSSSSGGSGGLGTGAKIGIGIGVPVIALLGVAAGYFIFRNLNKKKAPADYSTSAGPPAAQPYDPSKPIAYTPMVMSEVSGDSAHQHPYEMSNEPAQPHPYEMYAPTPEHR